MHQVSFFLPNYLYCIFQGEHVKVVKMGDGWQQAAPLKDTAERHIETAAISKDSNNKRAKTHAHKTFHYL